MSTEQNKSIYRNFIQQVFNEGRLERLDEFLGPGYTIGDAGQSPQGPEGVRSAVSMFRGAFPDLQITLDHVIAEGDTVATRSTLTGTHRGPFFGIEPTGRPVKVTSLTMVRLVDGRLVESWVKTDTAAMMAQLGAGVPA